VQLAPPLTIAFELLDTALRAVAEELERLESPAGHTTNA
jgi:hypothetical protein